jgi:peptide/nickel transport system ATP-binding protein
MNSVPKLGANTERLTAIGGAVPQLGAFPGGCRFHPRCPKAQARCATTAPALEEVLPGRFVRCPLWEK